MENHKSFVNIYRRSREVLINEDADGQIVDAGQKLSCVGVALIKFLSICLCGGVYDTSFGGVSIATNQTPSIPNQA